MKIYCRWLLIFTLLALTSSASAITFLKGSNDTGGTPVHVTTILTHSSQPTPVKVRIMLGQWRNSHCQYHEFSPAMVELVKDHDTIEACNECLKSLAEQGFTCMTWEFVHNENRVADTYKLIWNGHDYVGSKPMTSTVDIR